MTGSAAGRFGQLILGMLALALPGCVHMRPQAAVGCLPPAYPLLVSANEQHLTGPAAVSVRSFRQELSERLAAAPNLRGRPPGGTRKVLVLSGGSQHGAFGAGLLRGLPSVPDYPIVTAVSTGALQSVFVFLANRPVPGDRIYPAHMRADPGIGAPGTSNLTDLALAESISREADLMHVGAFSYAGAAVRGSMADFRPLRAMIAGLLSKQTLEDIATEADGGRLLLIGVSNLDDGLGYAIDLTRLAQQARDAGHVEAARPCFVDALVASSTVPPGVPPVTLRTTAAPAPHLYVDGGARFGVFFDQLREVVDAKAPADIDLIVNGVLYGRPWLDSGGKSVIRWSLVNVELRTVDLLENQVYRFSVDDVERWALANGTLRLAFISNEGLSHVTEDPDDHEYAGLSCAKAAAVDDRDKPMEFHPRYMRCLIDYGQQRGKADPWNKTVAPQPTH